MNYYMMVEPLIKDAYWCNRYTDGIRDEIKRNKGTLTVVGGFDSLDALINTAKEEGVRPVLLVNCISRQWIYDCISRLLPLRVHPLLIAPLPFVPATPVSTVSFDFINAFYALCRYLYDAGRKSIALFGVNPVSSNDITKNGAYYMFADDYGMTKNVFWNRGCLQSCCDELYGKLHELDAVVCSNDVVAVKLIGYLRERGIEVPKRLYVATMGNTALSKSMHPDITICEFNCEQIGRQAVRLCGVLTKNPELSSLCATVSGEILPRKSTAFHPANANPSVRGKVAAENINFYSDGDVSRIFCMEKLLSGCDELDMQILNGLVCGRRLLALAEELFVSENTIKYRIRKMQMLAQTKSRRDLIRLFSEFLM